MKKINIYEKRQEGDTIFKFATKILPSLPDRIEDRKYGVRVQYHIVVDAGYICYKSGNKILVEFKEESNYLAGMKMMDWLSAQNLTLRNTSTVW